MGITNVASSWQDGELKIIEFVRNGLYREMRFKECRQYFYALLEECSGLDDYEIVDKRSVFNDEVARVYFPSSNYNDKKQTISMFSKTFEADVPIEMRHILDTGLKFDNDRRIFYMDIETDFCNTPQNPEKPVISIVIYDNIVGKYVVWAWRGDKTQGIVNGPRADTEYRIFNDEYSMLDDFGMFFHNCAPDILTGWYLVDFDVPYLFNRMELMGIDMKVLSQSGGVYKGKKSGWKIAGCAIVDLLEMYKRVTWRKPADFKLDTVAKFVLGNEFGKVKHEGISEMWRNNFDKLIEYNVMDVELIVKINQKASLMSFFFTVQDMTPMLLEDTFLYSRVVDYYMLHRFKDTYVFPSKVTRLADDQKYEGGYVLDPPRGVFNNIAIADFASMYPSIIKTFNISPETKNTRGKIHIEGVTFFSKSQKLGIIPQMMDELKKTRDGYKKERDKYDSTTKEYKIYDDLQGTAKTIMNTFYGVMGFPTFRLFDIDVAKSVTAVGREMIKHAKRVAESQGNKVVYGDTDSIMIQMDKHAEPLVVAESAIKLIKHINSTFDEFKNQYGEVNEHFLKMECEKVFQVVMFTGKKKRYIGVVKWHDGKLVDNVYARGFEIVRRDTPELIKDILKKSFRMILEHNDERIVKQFIKQSINQIKSHDIYLLCPTKNLAHELSDYGNLPQHAKAAQIVNDKYGTDYKRSDKPRILYVKHLAGDKKIRVIALPEDWQERGMKFEVDWDVYLEKQLFDKLEEAFEIRGWTIELNQKTLKDFFFRKNTEEMVLSH